MPDRGELVGGTTVWVDIDFPIIPRSTGTTIASYTAIDTGGVLLYPQWQVNDFHVCDANELVHGWKEGSNISWHLHLITMGQDASDRYTKWELIWASANVNDILEERTTITTDDTLISANTAAKTHLIVPIGSVAMTGYRIAAHLYPRLKRVAASGAAPSVNPCVPMLQAHVELDTLGSLNITTK